MVKRETFPPPNSPVVITEFECRELACKCRTLINGWHCLPICLSSKWGIACSKLLRQHQEWCHWSAKATVGIKVCASVQGHSSTVYSSICQYTAKGDQQISIDHHFLAVDRVIPEQMKRFEEEVRQHVEEESQKQRYLLNVIYQLFHIKRMECSS